MVPFLGHPLYTRESYEVIDESSFWSILNAWFLIDIND